MTRAAGFLLLCDCAAAALLPSASARAQAGPASAATLAIPASGNANPTTRVVTLTVPLRDAGRYLGDVIVAIDPDDTLQIPVGRLLDLLDGTIDPDELAGLRRQPLLTLADLSSAGVALAYNPQELALDLSISSGHRAVRSLKVSPLEAERVGQALRPARFSSYLNARGAIDYLYGDGGFEAPLMLFDSATRLFGAVIEAEASVAPGGRRRAFARSGARLVIDQREGLARFTAGDLQPLGRGFQSLTELAGLSVFRSYGVLQPQRVARPRGGRAFTLTRPSTIEVEVNGQLVRRLQLEAGNYDLQDFPFTQGANDVRLAIVDDAGRSEILNFNVFLDQAQLGRGLTEFGAYVGVRSEIGPGGPRYSNDPAITGFVRHGYSDRLTLGANAQGDRDGQMAGVEALWSSPIGTVGLSQAVSQLRGGGFGQATLINFQRISATGRGGSSALNAFVERRSSDFTALGVIRPLNPFRWEAGGGYSRGLTENLHAGIDGRYSRGRGFQPDLYTARATAAWQLANGISLGGEVRYEQDNLARRVAGLLTATIRLDRFSSLRADYDTRFSRSRIAYSSFRGQGVGSYNLNADAIRTNVSSGINLAANYFANRGELGISHNSNFEDLFGRSVSQRTSARGATSLAFADGAFSIGRPIFDSFAIVRARAGTKAGPIDVERTPFGVIAQTGALGSAVHPGLSAFIDRVITIEAPEAPATADLGQGSFRVLPAYRSGYRLTVGSGYSVTAVGRLVDDAGEPVSLASATVRQLGETSNDERREPIAIFTNREGRFGAVGLAPGRWQIEITGGGAYILDIAEDADGVVQAGELRPAAAAE